MKYFIVKEMQTCYTEYLVKAESATQAKSKAKKIDQDCRELNNSPVFVDTISFEAKPLKEEEEKHLIIERAMNDIELQYIIAEEEVEPAIKKIKRRRSKKNEIEDLDKIMELLND